MLMRRLIQFLIGQVVNRRVARLTRSEAFWLLWSLCAADGRLIHKEAEGPPGNFPGYQILKIGSIELRRDWDNGFEKITVKGKSPNFSELAQMAHLLPSVSLRGEEPGITTPTLGDIFAQALGQ